MSIKHLSYKQKASVLKDFPTIKLSYETIAHKKVNEYDFVYAIPQGKKCFAWFTVYEDQPVCFVMDISFHTAEMNKQKNMNNNSNNNNNNSFYKKRSVSSYGDYDISNISIYPCCFDKKIAYVTGTIFYGTQFYRYPDKEQTYFTIQDVFYYKSKDITNISIKEKLILTRDVFSKQEELKQIAYTKHFIVFGMPVATSSWKEMEELVTNKSITYRVSFFQFRRYNSYTKDPVLAIRSNDIHTNTNTSQNTNTNKSQNTNLNINYNSILNQNQTEPLKQQHKQPVQTNKSNQQNKTNINQSPQAQQKQYLKSAIFLVKPDIETDIYHLYCKHKEINEYYYNIACVPDYKTSVLMNKLFRNIKENDNLDSLEESDDEEEFEDDKTDKYVYLDRKFYMYCLFNMKFKKWTPIRLAATYEIKNLCNYNDISV